MTVYGSSRDQSAGPDEPRRPSPDPHAQHPDNAPGDPGTRNVYGDPGTRNVYGDSGAPATRNVYGDPAAPGPRNVYGDPRDQQPGNPYGDQGTRNVYGEGTREVRGQAPGGYGDQGIHDVYGEGTREVRGQAPGGYGDQGTRDVHRQTPGGYGEGTRNVYGESTRDVYGDVQGERRGHGYGPEDLYGDPGRRRPAFESASYGTPAGPATGPPTSGSGWQQLTGPGAVAGGAWAPGGVGASGTRENAGSGVGAPPPGKVKAPRVTGARRTAIIVGVVAVLVVGAGTAAAATLLGGKSGSPAAAGPTTGAPAGGGTGGPSAAPAGQGAGAPVGPAGGITLSATGDVVMGMAPTGLPPNNGKGFFDPVKSALVADLEMGNLEQTITDDTGVGKCSAASAGKTCFAFRTPPAFAQNLKDAGFGLMNEANNHAYDFGPAGYQNTRKNLDSMGIKYTGWPGEIPVVDVKGVKVAVIGFASYTWSNLCYDLDKATTLIKQAATKADLVVIQVHQGGEGADKTHVKPGTEMFLGENRCDPIAFAHNAIDAGADLVIGHGPHVMRAMEFYKGHLIAYSLGNFAGYHALTVNGVLAVGGVLKVTLLGDGTFKGATLASTKMVAPGSPRLDPDKSAISLVSGLSKADFPTTGAKISTTGTITPP